MDRAKVREVMDLTLCTEARARAALAAANGDQRAAVNEVLSPTTPSLHERTLQDTLRRRGQTADEAFADRDLREAMQRSMGSGKSANEERDMVERLRLHTDTTRVEARAALVACGWHEGRAAEQLLPAQIYLSPQDRRAEKIRQVREIARVDARWAELALDACDGDAEAAVAFVCGGMSPPSQRAATALDESSSVLAAARRARATPLPNHDDRPAPLATPASPVVRTAPPTTEQNLVSPKALDAIPDADVVAQAAADLERALREAEGRKLRAPRRSLPSPVTPLSPERRAASLAAASTTLAAASLEMQQRLDAAAARDAANEALQAERDRNRRAALAAAEQRAREAAKKRAAAALRVQAAHRGRNGRVACVARREAAALLLACARRRLDRVTAQAELSARRDATLTLSSCARRRQDRLTAQAEAERRRDAGETLRRCARRRQDRLAAQAEVEERRGAAATLGASMRQRQARLAAQAEADRRREAASALGGGAKCALARRRVAAERERALERLRREADAAADRARRENAARVHALEAAVVVEPPPAKPAVVVVETPAVETVVQPVEPPPPVEETATPTIEETPVPVAPAEPVVEPRPAKAPHQLVERVLTQLAKPAVYPGKKPEPAAVPKQRRPTNPRGRTVEARTTERELDPLERLRRAARNAAREKRSAAGSALVAVRMSSSLDGRFSGDFGGRVPMRKL